MAHPVSDDTNVTGCSVDWGATFVNPISQLQLLQSLFDAQRTDSVCEESVRWSELFNRLQQKMIQDEEEFDGLIGRLSDIKHTIKKLRASISHLKSRRDGLKNQLTELSQENSRNPDVNEFSNEFISSNLTHLSETVQQFERLFGICLQRTSSDTLQILFHGCSGPTASDIVCNCQLRYNRLGRFEGLKCNPPVPDFERLVNQLNLTVDMRSFVILLRRRFCRYFELAAAISNKVD